MNNVQIKYACIKLETNTTITTSRQNKQKFSFLDSEQHMVNKTATDQHIAVFSCELIKCLPDLLVKGSKIGVNYVDKLDQCLTTRFP